jgi:membrane protein
MIDRALELRENLAERLRAFFDNGPIRRNLRALAQGLTRDRVSRAASAMAFDLFLAAIPMLALAGWLFASLLSASPNAVTSTSLLLDVTPEQVYDLLDRHFRRFSAVAIAPLAFASSMWLISSAFHTCISVFEGAVHVKRRPWWSKRSIALICALIAIVALALTGWAAVLLAGGPAALLSPLGDEVRTARYAALLIGSLAATTLLAAFFRIAVRRPGVRRRVWPGAFAAVLIGSTSSWGFGHYAPAIARYTLFYGSLAAVAILLIWLWLWCAAVLVGAELNAVLEGGNVESDEEPD